MTLLHLKPLLDGFLGTELKTKLRLPDALLTVILFSPALFVGDLPVRLHQTELVNQPKFLSEGLPLRDAF